MTPEDRAAFVDARIAAVHAGLKLTPDQEKLWPPVEAAVRDFAKLRIDRANARMKAQNDAKDQQDDDPVARLRERADTMAATAEAMKKIADAADPLYKTLDDAQKRRLAILTHRDGRFGGEGAGGTAGWSAVSTGIGTGRAGMATAPSGSKPLAQADQDLREAAGFRRLFCHWRAGPKDGKTLSLCWTSRGRFAKRPASCEGFPDRQFRAHSSVGRAADS